MTFLSEHIIISIIRCQQTVYDLTASARPLRQRVSQGAPRDVVGRYTTLSFGFNGADICWISPDRPASIQAITVTARTGHWPD